MWRTDRGFLAIGRVGKRFVDYQFMKVLGQRGVRSRLATPDTLAEFLRANAVHLIEGA